MRRSVATRRRVREVSEPSVNPSLFYSDISSSGTPRSRRESFLLSAGRTGRTAIGMQTQTGEITRLLAGWRNGDRAALDRLLPLVRVELDRVARRHIGREGPHHSMQPSSLVQEAFVRLLRGG